MTLEEFKKDYKKDCMNFVRAWSFVRCDRGCVEIYSAKKREKLLSTINDCCCANYSSIKDAYDNLIDDQQFLKIFNSCDLVSFLNYYNETHDNVDIEITLLD